MEALTGDRRIIELSERLGVAAQLTAEMWPLLRAERDGDLRSSNEASLLMKERIR